MKPYAPSGGISTENCGGGLPGTAWLALGCIFTSQFILFQVFILFWIELTILAYVSSQRRKDVL